MSLKLGLVSLVSEMVNEVGDLTNIEIYPYKTYVTGDGYAAKFTAALPNNTEVEVEALSQEVGDTHIQRLKLPPVFEKENPTETITVFNFEFTVGEDDAQFAKTDFRTFVRIVATVVKFLKQIIVENEQSYYKPLYVIISTSKTGYTGTKDTKLDYYRAVLNNNLPPGYRMGRGMYDSMEVLAIQKIKE
jgi:hypothetical protein